MSSRLPARASLRFRMTAALPNLVAIWVAACEPASEQTPALLRIEALPVIGQEAGDGPDVFGRVGDIELDNDGNVYVLDRSGRVVQVFDEDGVFLRTIGRRGRGPGELENPVAVGWGPEGYLWIVDPGNGRYAVFDPLGELVATHRRAAEGVAGGWPVTFAGDRLYDISFDFGPGGPYPVPVEYEITQQEVRRVQQVELPPLGRWGPGGIEVEREGRLLLIDVPFSPMLLWHVDTNRNVWYANTAAYEIRRRSLEDGSEVVFARSISGLPVTQAETDAALEEDPVLERAMIPTVKPSITAFFPGEKGDLWVLRSSDVSRGAKSQVDTFDANAALLATLELDLDFEPRPKVRDGIVVGVIRDELGVERVARYRIIQ